MRIHAWMAGVPAALLLVAAFSGVAPAREKETIHQVYDTGASPRLSLTNINGDLTLEGWDQKRIQVTAVKSASSGERLQDIRVHFRMDDDHLRIEVDIDGDTGRSRGGEHASVDFTIKVPRGTRVDAVELVNGDVEVTHIEGDVGVSSVNGDVSGRMLGGHVDLATVNGTLSLVATGGAESIRMHSVNGGVTLVLPRKFDARISAGTVHGSIRAVDGLDVEATSFTGSSMQGTIGRGGMKVDLNTVNGSIEIRRGG